MLHGTKLTVCGRLYEVEVTERSVSFDGVSRALTANERLGYSDVVAAISGAADEDEYLDALEKRDLFIQSLNRYVLHTIIPSEAACAARLDGLTLRCDVINAWHVIVYRDDGRRVILTAREAGIRV